MMGVYIDSLLPKEVLTGILVPSFIWKLICIILIIVNLKSLPLVWHIRLLNAVRFVLRSERSRTPLIPAQLFQPLITESRGSLMELDYNIHKSNSTYFQDVDIARAHLICTLFSKGIEQARNSRSQALIGDYDKTFGVALGAVCCSFKTEINLFERYEMWTRVLSWDRKWIYLITHFVRKDKVKPRRFSLYPQQKNKNSGTRTMDKKEDAVVASALSKLVFKRGRLTIPPEIMLQASGLLPRRPSDILLPHTQVFPEPRRPDIAQTICNIPFRFFEQADLIYEATRNSLFPDKEDDQKSREESPDEIDKKEHEWTWAKVEEERQRGLDMAQNLARLEGLAGEFTAEADALGKHSDLYWFLGLTY